MLVGMTLNSKKSLAINDSLLIVYNRILTI